jgi:hypothetical protein
MSNRRLAYMDVGHGGYVGPILHHASFLRAVDVHVRRDDQIIRRNPHICVCAALGRMAIRLVQALASAKAQRCSG